MTSIPVWIAWLKYLSFVYYGTPTSNTITKVHMHLIAILQEEILPPLPL